MVGIQSYHPASPKKSAPSDKEAAKEGGEAKAGDEAKAEEEKGENKNEPSGSPAAADDSILEGLTDEIQEMLKACDSEFSL